MGDGSGCGVAILFVLFMVVAATGSAIVVRDEMHRSAVKAGVGEWTVNQEGKASFRWKSPEQEHPE